MKPFVEFFLDAIGTKWHISIFDDLSQSKSQKLLEDIKRRIEAFDKNYSRFRKDSLVTKMSQEAGTYSMPEDAEQLLSMYRKCYEITNGLFTPLIGKLLSDAGYDANYSFKSKPLKKPAHWEEVLEYKNGKLTMKKPAILDFGAAGKGYLIDIIGKLLHQNNVHSFCINAGGDILYQTQNKDSLKVGLEDPLNTQKAIGIARIKNQSICGSAGNRRTWGNFHHIMNPETLISPRHILAVWAIADSALIADAMTTCLFFESSKKLQQEYDFECLILFADFSIEKSPNFPAELFTTN